MANQIRRGASARKDARVPRRTAAPADNAARPARRVKPSSRRSHTTAGITSLAGARIEYRIYPSIGIARVGNAKDGFFLGPEAPGIAPEGPFRSADGIMPQGARFRIYRLDIDSNENETVIAEILPTTSIQIQWTVRLANRKAAGAKILDTLGRKPQPALRNKGFNREKLVISGEGSIEGFNSAGSPLTGSIEFAQGKSQGQVVTDINLATLRTDANGRLVVVGGPGASGSPFNSPLPSFADNDGWYDSVSDGPVTATLIIDGQTQPVIPAWAVVTVPRYAPEIYGVVTWFDQAVAMARTSDDGTVDPPRTTSFTRDLYPVLKRGDGLHWVHRGTHAGGQRPLSDAARIQELQDGQAARARLLAKLTPLNREAAGPELRPQMPAGAGFQMPLLNSGANPDPKGPTWAYLSLTWYQMAHFQNWLAGNFDADWPGHEPPPKAFDQIPLGDQPHALSEAALEACIGGPFFPGIEGTYDIARLATYHSEPHLRRDFRINVEHPAGFLTEKMALPWQADYADCSDYWWPSQRPVRVTKQDGTSDRWDRGINGVVRDGHLNMVDFWSELAFVLRDAASGNFAEVGRQLINGIS
jgi:hypothetical protein